MMLKLYNCSARMLLNIVCNTYIHSKQSILLTDNKDHKIFIIFNIENKLQLLHSSLNKMISASCELCYNRMTLHFVIQGNTSTYNSLTGFGLNINNEMEKMKYKTDKFY